MEEHSFFDLRRNGERHRAKVTRQVVEIIDQDNGQRVENINFILDIGNGKVEELISYNQLLEHLENAQDHDMGMDQELYRFRAIIGHQHPLLASDWKGSKYNVQVEWETGEITFDTIPTRNGRELGEIWVSKVRTNF